MAGGGQVVTKSGQVGKMLRWINLYPPFVGGGVRVTREADGSITTRMRLRWWNRNAVGTHFGGSLFAMADPFFVLLLLDRLGPRYIVWDKAASIRFRRPGRGTVTARFAITDQEVQSIRETADRGGSVEPVFPVTVLDENGEVVAEIERRLYVKRRDADKRTKSAD
jgi:acyl-coenzyme A thioesterase PaaI-like protein